MTDHVKQSYVRTKENIMQSTEKSSDRENNPVGYAEDVASEYADRIFHETGHQVRRQAEKLLFLRQAKKLFTSRKNKCDQYRLQVEKRHRSRGENLLPKKSRPLNGIKERSRQGELRNRL